MHIDISRVLVEEHHQRLRDAAQGPANPLIVRIWAMVRRREPAPVTRMAARELERLAA